MFSGQFTDALQALIDWLYRVEPQLAEDQPVHGDVDLVMNLIDNHKVLQPRASCFAVRLFILSIEKGTSGCSSLLRLGGHASLHHHVPTDTWDGADPGAIFQRGGGVSISKMLCS